MLLNYHSCMMWSGREDSDKYQRKLWKLIILSKHKIQYIHNIYLQTLRLVTQTPGQWNCQAFKTNIWYKTAPSWLHRLRRLFTSYLTSDELRSKWKLLIYNFDQRPKGISEIKLIKLKLVICILTKSTYTNTLSKSEACFYLIWSILIIRLKWLDITL